MSRIFFVSFYQHQYELFSALAGKLKKRHDVRHINIYRSFFARMAHIFNPLRLISRDSGISLTPTEKEDLLSFSFQKRIVRTDLFKNRRAARILRAILSAQVDMIVDFFSSSFQNNRPDLVVVWNGLAHPLAAVTTLAEKMGIPTLYLENGYLPETITADPAGVNYRSSLTSKPPSFFRGIDIDEKLLEKLYSSGLGENGNGPDDLADQFIFFPFQVHDDSQILKYSPLVKDMGAFLRLGLDAVKNLNSELGTDYQIVAKEHPADRGRIDYSALKESCAGEPVIFAEGCGVPPILETCQMVVTINSTVGIEALVMNRPVVTLGRAFYNVDGLVHHAEAKEQLLDRMKDGLRQGFDSELRDGFLYFLRYHYLVERNSPSDNEMLIKRIADLAQGTRYFWMEES